MSWCPPWVKDPTHDSRSTDAQEDARRHDAIEKRISEFVATLSSTDNTCVSSMDTVRDAQQEPGSSTEDVPAVPTVPSDSNATTHCSLAITSSVPDFKKIWYECVTGTCMDTYGYGRSPAYWFTLNCPYNYLHEIHRFQDDDKCLEPFDRVSREMRFRWSLDNPDLVCQLHAMRVEFIIRMVIPLLFSLNQSSLSNTGRVSKMVIVAIHMPTQSDTHRLIQISIMS